MNNRGFAISGILYGVLLLFLMVLLSLLYVLVTRINRLTLLVDEVNAQVENKEYKTIGEVIDTTNHYITTYRGKYEIKINNTSICYAYLPKDILIKINNNKIVYLLPDANGEIDINNTTGLKELPLIECTNNNITKFNIEKIYSSLFTT